MITILLLLALLLGSVTPVPQARSAAQDCPTFTPGEPAVIVNADVFDGHPVVVFQPGITQDGGRVWIVELLRDGQPRPFGYLAVSACDLER